MGSYTLLPSTDTVLTGTAPIYTQLKIKPNLLRKRVSNTYKPKPQISYIMEPSNIVGFMCLVWLYTKCVQITAKTRGGGPMP